MTLRWTINFFLLLLPLGCTPAASLQPKVHMLEGGPPYLYTEADWGEVLRTHVRDGLVDFAGLARDRQRLDRYYALLSQVGPVRTPGQFTTAEHAVAYWINAYNALVLLAVLECYPVDSVYDVSLPNLEYEYTFVVDGHAVNLAVIEQRVMESSHGDVRALFALSRAAMGTPRLPQRPMRAGGLEQQLASAATDALDNPAILRIDHRNRTVLVWQVILRRQAAFLAFWESHRRVQPADAFDVLMELASAPQRRAMKNAVGYPLREMPFDRRLNEWRGEGTTDGRLSEW
jgi:hypothetical protein